MKVKTRLVLILAGLLSAGFAFKTGIEKLVDINHFKNIIPEKVYFMNYEITMLSNLKLGEIDPSKMKEVTSRYLLLVEERTRLYRDYPDIKKAVDYVNIHPTNKEIASVIGYGLLGSLAVGYGVNNLTAEIKKRKKRRFKKY